ncbi:MAG TPA: hypothetical protein VJ953_05305 [Saprospiraceae bacterium]|nr:hypothetical protein [Saprospiraceae bacterium]
MILSNRSFVVTLLFFIGGLSSMEGQNCTGGEFATAILAVQKHEELNQKIKEVFPKLTRSRRRLRFKVDSRIEYIPLYNAFENTTSQEQMFLDSLTEVVSPAARSNYDIEQRFESYNINRLPSLSPDPAAHLTLRFSTCTSKYIVAEFLDGRMNFGRIRYGKVLHILFILDDSGFVDDIIYSSYTYN